MPGGDYTIEAGFLEAPGRQLFQLTLSPVGAPRGAVLFLHAFAEEMHMSRRNVAVQARALAADGFEVVLLDFTGCGDGDGDFADATVACWREDAACALAALRERTGLPVVLWGMRAGALLACELSRQAPGIERLLLWQPVLNGEQQVDQFLRLRATADAIESGGGFDRKALWNQLRSGQALEIAGYLLSPAMAMELATLRLLDMTPACPVSWLEVSLTESTEPALPSQRVISRWRDAGLEVDVTAVPGSPFWRNHDAPVNVELQRATLETLA